MSLQILVQESSHPSGTIVTSSLNLNVTFQAVKSKTRLPSQMPSDARLVSTNNPRSLDDEYVRFVRDARYFLRTLKTAMRVTCCGRGQEISENLWEARTLIPRSRGGTKLTVLRDTPCPN